MRRLPPHHIRRPRLTDRCAGHQVIVVEAAAGYGKSVLGAELVDGWRTVGIDVQLEQSEVSPSLFAARVRGAVMRAGFSEASAAVDGAADDPRAAVGAVAKALVGERCAWVVDDAHNASREAASLIELLADSVGADQHLVVLARQLPAGAGDLGGAGRVHLGSNDLALTQDETLQLCRAGFGLDIEADAAQTLDRATGGWTAATALAAARAVRTGEAVGVVAAAARRTDRSADAVAAILAEALTELGAGARPALAQVARLPLLDAEVVDRATSIEGFFDRGLAAGIPFTPTSDGWWDLPGPVRDHLSTFAPQDHATMCRAAREYDRRGELAEALELLAAAGAATETAALLASAPHEEVEELGVLELIGVVEQLPDEVLDAHPAALLHVGRALTVAARWDKGRPLFDRARAVAVRTGDEVLARATAVEFANEMLRDLRHEEGAEAARAILRDAHADEALTRARADQVLGMALCWRVDADGRRDEVALAEAERCFTRASATYRALGMRSQLSILAVYWAVRVDFARGQSATAMARLDEALTMVADRPRRRAWALCFRAWFAADLGQDDVCRASTDEILRVAEQLDSDLFRAQAHWKLAILASYRGEADATLTHLREVEQHKGVWWEPASGDFLAEAADLVDRVGYTTLAAEYLARVKADPKDAGHLVALADAAIEARHGDPDLAIERLSVLAHTPIDPREHWRVTLLAAHAALRRGERDAAGLLAAQAFGEAASLGQPALPLIRERVVTEELHGLAVATGAPAALALTAEAMPVSLALLGRFELTVAGAVVPVGRGQAERLLKLIALSGGRLHAEAAVEALWPEVAADAGHHRLRTVLNRLRAAVGPVVVREGELLVLADGVRVDLAELLDEARRAEALAASDPALASAVARGAIARYRGELLADDHDAVWAEGPRARVHAVVLDLLDLCARESARRGDLDALRRDVQRTIELAPYDDERYLAAATALYEQGRQAEALSVVHRARSAFEEIGLATPQSLLDLEAAIVA